MRSIVFLMYNNIQFVQCTLFYELFGILHKTEIMGCYFLCKTEA